MPLKTESKISDKEKVKMVEEGTWYFEEEVLGVDGGTEDFVRVCQSAQRAQIALLTNIYIH